MRNCIFLILTLLCAVTCAAAVTDNNIRISRLEIDCTFRTDKSGKPTRVDQQSRYTFTNTDEAPSPAVCATGYRDADAPITKAKSTAKDTKTTYAPSMSPNVFYSDSKICLMKFTVDPDKPVNVVIDQRFTIPQRFTMISLAEPYDIDEAVVTLTCPAEMKERLQIMPQMLPADATMTESTDGKTYSRTYTLRNLPAVTEQPMAPEARAFAPKLLINASFDNLGELYGYIHSFTTHPDPDPGAIDRLSAEITARASTPEEKIAAINDWVHGNIRYLAVVDGENAHRPDAPSEVARKRYGDCKGTAALLKSLLASAGMDARLVWVGTREIKEEWSDIPVMTCANHMICCAMLPGKDEPLYIDGTASSLPAGTIPQQIAGKQTLIEDGDHFVLGRIPAVKAADNTDITEFDLTLTPGDSAIMLDGTVTRRFTGEPAFSFAKRMKSIKPSEFSSKLETLLSVGRKNILKITEMATDSTSSASGRVDAIGLIGMYSGRMIINFRFQPHLKDMVIDTKNRTTPAELPYVSADVERATIHLPEGFPEFALPEAAEFDNRWFSGSVTYTLTDPLTLVAEARFCVKDSDIPLDSIDEFNNNLRQYLKAISAGLTINLN